MDYYKCFTNFFFFFFYSEVQITHSVNIIHKIKTLRSFISAQFIEIINGINVMSQTKYFGKDLHALNLYSIQFYSLIIRGQIYKNTD